MNTAFNSPLSNGEMLKSQLKKTYLNKKMELTVECFSVNMQKTQLENQNFNLLSRTLNSLENV